MSRVGNCFQTFEQVQSESLESENMSCGRFSANVNDRYTLHQQNAGCRFHGIDGIPSTAFETAKVIDAGLASKGLWMRHQANSGEHSVDVVEKIGKAGNKVKKTYESYTPDEKLTVGTVLAGGVAGAAALTGISYFIGQVLKSLGR
ncbi:MAG: hypothetical protein JSR39_10935 [Verrucomicrobia bacterium]|nr:hypothetical protein [Verrucomicrobiota bacterium]